MPPVTMARPDGPRFRDLRESLGYTRAELGRRARSGRNAVWKAETGRPVSKMLMARFARALKVDLSEITVPEDRAAPAGPEPDRDAA